MKIISSDCDHTDQNPEKEILAKAGLDLQIEQCKTEDEVIQRCKGAEILLNQFAPLSRRVLEALAPQLKLVIRYGVGVDNVDLVAATDLGVQVCNVPDYGFNEVAEHALALTLDLARKTTLMNNRVQAGGWNYEDAVPLRRLSTLTLGIAGMGRNGRTFAKKAQNIFGRIIAHSPHFRPNSKDGTDFVEAVDQDSLLARSDILVLHMPLTDQTRHIINEASLAKMKPGAMLVNVSRGGLVDEAALAQALKAGRISAAALDVTEQEPVNPASPLLGHDNVLITPHMAWYSLDAEHDLKQKTADEAVRFAQHKPLEHPVNKLGQ